MKATEIWVWFAVLGMTLAVQGCREDEQNRPLLHDKGTYQGRPDQALSEEQLNTLRRRSAGQEF